MNEVEMQSDPVDYGEWKSGVNTAGTLSAVNGFVGKVGMAIASSVGTAMPQFGGFDATQTIQTVTAQHYITAMYIWVPIITNIATIVTMIWIRFIHRLLKNLMKGEQTHNGRGKYRS